MAPLILKPPKSLLRHVGRAIADFGMIRDGDRILLGVSGGKDSLSLLHILRHLQGYAPVRFELAVLTVDPEVPGFDPRPLTDYFDSLGVPWHYEQQPIMEEAKERMDGDSFCAYCSRMKRGIMYRICRREGYGVLALAQHLDDLAESLLMSLFHGGQLRTMKAHYVNDAGDMRIIRPLVYCRERQTADFAVKAGLPVVPDSCPACFSVPSQREHMKTLLASEEQTHAHLFANILHAIRPLMSDSMSAVAHVVNKGFPTPYPEHVDQRVILHNVSWQDYERVLAIRGESGGTRITYFHGDLELMTPSIDHESYKTRLARLLETYAEERDIDLEGYGSWTLKAQAKSSGVEPDECYVIGTTTPAPSVPDLAIEVVWTSGGIGKLEVYRRFGVPEVWFWQKGRLRIFVLERDGYEQRPRGKLLPELDLGLLGGFMHDGMSQTQAVRAFRRGLRQ